MSAITSDPLLDLAEEINAAHAGATAKAAEAVEHARKCGELLIEAKGRLGHGEWLPWLKANCTVKKSMAANYVKVAKNWKRIESKFPVTGNLTIEGALKVLDDGKKKPAKVRHNSGNEEWYTPPEYLEAARKVMGGIDLDPASCGMANEWIHAKRYFTKEDDALGRDTEWAGRVWINPPYTAGLVDQFVSKLITSLPFNRHGDDLREHGVEGKVSEAILLVNNSTDTKWFADAYLFASAVCFPTGRIKFIDSMGQEQDSPLHGNCFMYFGQRPARFLTYFQKFGPVFIQPIDWMKKDYDQDLDDLLENLERKHGPQQVTREEFRKHAVQHHPDLGGDAAKFTKVVTS